MSSLIEDFIDMLGSLGQSTGGRRKKKCDHCGKIIFSVVVLVIVGIVSLHNYMSPKLDTDRILRTEAGMLCADENYIGSAADGWGNDLMYNATELEEPTLMRRCEVRSAGRDGEYFTEDDMTRVAQNIHVMRSVGKATKKKIGELAGEFMRGFRTGSPPAEE